MYRQGAQYQQQYPPRRRYQLPAPKTQYTKQQWCLAFIPQYPVNQQQPQQPQLNPTVQALGNIGPSFTCGQYVHFTKSVPRSSKVKFQSRTSQTIRVGSSTHKLVRT